MRSFAKALAAVLLLAATTPALDAQSTQPRRLYDEALAREAELRRELDTLPSGAQDALQLRRLRALVTAYEDMAGLFPASGYGDNSLWQGASLSAEAFWQFGESADQATALRLFNALTSRFPTSSRARLVPAQVKRLEAVNGSRASTLTPHVRTPAVATEVEGGPKGPPLQGAPLQGPPRREEVWTAGAALKSIRREVLPNALRITLELEREVPFHDERLEAPPRVFLDLQNTRAVDALKDAVIPFDDDVVAQIRVGRHLDSRTRVVLDLKAPGGHSVYALYNPYRVVIDFERTRDTKGGNTKDTTTRDPAAKDTKTTTVVAAIPAHEPGASWIPVPDAGRVPGRGPTDPDGERAVRSGPGQPATAGTAPTSGVTTAAGGDAGIAPKPPSVNTGGGFSLSRQLGLSVTRIVIDAGHGGRDPGAKVKGLTEAEIVLDVAIRLEKLLLNERGVEVLLTRRTDAYIPLEERTAIANRGAADLFLSIHANASADGAARGIETYFLNFAPNKEAEAIAARENAGSSKSMRHLPDIVKAIALNNKIDESRDFATIVQASLYGRLRKANKNLKNLGVKQAPFMVLIGATMPGVLAEISFMSNGPEATLLKTEKYRQQIAESLFDGVMRYQQSLKKVPAVAAR